MCTLKTEDSVTFTERSRRSRRAALVYRRVSDSCDLANEIFYDGPSAALTLPI